MTFAILNDLCNVKLNDWTCGKGNEKVSGGNFRRLKVTKKSRSETEGKDNVK